MDAKELLKKVRLRGEETTKRVTLYIDKEAYAAFQKACGTAKVSHVVEEFMREFAESAAKKGGAK